MNRLDFFLRLPLGTRVRVNTGQVYILRRLPGPVKLWVPVDGGLLLLTTEIVELEPEVLP